MSKLGISTGTAPNSGDGDNLLQGAVKINSNFNEIYNFFGDGSNLIYTGIGTTGSVNTTGIITASAFSGNFSGGNITAVGATFTGNVSIAGTLTYEDVTNVDSVGLITARDGIRVSGIVTARAGYAVTYYGDGSQLTGIANTANVVTDSLVVSGVATASSFIGNLTGTATTATTIDILNTNGLSNVFYPTFVEFRTDGQILRGDVDLTYKTDDNILTVPNISATSMSVGSTVTINSLGINATGIVTATGGFISVGNTTPIQISLSGNTLTFTAVGIGSTSFTLA